MSSVLGGVGGEPTFTRRRQPSPARLLSATPNRPRAASANPHPPASQRRNPATPRHPARRTPRRNPAPQPGHHRQPLPPPSAAPAPAAPSTRPVRAPRRACFYCTEKPGLTVTPTGLFDFTTALSTLHGRLRPAMGRARPPAQTPRSPAHHSRQPYRSSRLRVLIGLSLRFAALSAGRCRGAPCTAYAPPLWRRRGVVLLSAAVCTAGT